MKLICFNCGKEYESDHRNKKYCSRECYAQTKRGIIPSQLIGKRGNRPRKRKVSTCLVCGKSFEHWAGRNAKYCSKECWSIRNPVILNECLYCGKEYWARVHEGRKYCSHKCYSIHKRELITGANSHRWRGGKTQLAKLVRNKAVYNDWRLAVFVRDKYTCQNCGIQSGDGLTVYLQAHHIKPFSEYPELRFELTNGVTVCKNCHLLKHNHIF